MDNGTPRRAARAAADLAAALPGGRERSLTIPRQIADDLGVAIVDGELDDGRRILEEALAAHYGVSRSPVREALALLERRGLVRTVPRKGSYVVGQSLERIAEVFNIRAVLIGLAARYLARRRDAPALDELRDAVAELAAAAAQPQVSPLACARLGAAAADVIYRHCGAEYLRRMLDDHARGSSWGLIWRKRALDLLTPERRRRYADDFRRLVELIASGDDLEAERLLRAMMFDSRDNVLQSLAGIRGGVIDPVQRISDVVAPAATRPRRARRAA